MKTRIHLDWLLCCMLGTASSALAEYQVLTEPWLTFPAGFSESAKSNILARLPRTDCKFLSGSALNGFTSLKYAGDTVPLNLFMDGLAKCPGVTLSVLFYEGVDDEADWMVTHYAHEPGRLVVRINLKSARIKLDALVIPEINGPSLPQKK